MNSLCAILALLSFLLFTTTVESRIGAGGYMKNSIKKQPTPGDLRKLVKEQFERNNADLPDDKTEKANCNENGKPNTEFEIVEFEPRPDVTIYHGDIVEFEPRPDVTIYHGDFEPRPDVTIYHGDSEVTESRTLKDELESKAIGNMHPKDKGPKDKLPFEVKAKRHAFEEDFEPRPNISVYND
ncbi:organ-specific protein S2-like [Rosa rugosa]|uniref:organ-specific protein S2-like n=1 Tax=Rosa rugosa TaxID=74645 RepID=UPI002B4126F5|nr:organ-specific protein S2-like [Rosa rugosa]